MKVCLPLFGFATLEGLLDHHRAGTPIYVGVLADPHYSPGGTLRCATSLIASEVRNERVIYYWSLAIGDTVMRGDESTDDPRSAAIRALSQSARDLVSDIVNERFPGDLLLALLTVPQEVRLFEGTTCLLRVERLGYRYVRVSSDAGARSEPAADGEGAQ